MNEQSKQVPLTPPEREGRNCAYDAAYLYMLNAGGSVKQAHEHAEATAATHAPPHPNKPSPCDRIADALERIAAALEARLVDASKPAWFSVGDAPQAPRLYRVEWCRSPSGGEVEERHAIVVAYSAEDAERQAMARDREFCEANTPAGWSLWGVKVLPEVTTPGPWERKFAEDADAAWDELCADPPPGTWFWHTGINEWWLVEDDTTAAYAHKTGAAIIPESANDGREFIAVRPGVTLPEGLTHPMTEKSLRGGTDAD